MSAFIPLLQTGLWVGLIVWLIMRYKLQVGAILGAVQKRIEHGSSVKAGPFELGEGVQPQSLDEQKVRLAEESKTSDPTPAERQKARTPKRKYLLVEDLVLRKLQAEFGTPINRQVSVGRDIAFDGLFAKDGAGFGVEVKYVESSRVAVANYVTRALNQVLSHLSHLGWRRFTVILVLVFENRELMSPPVIQGIQKEVAQYGEKVVLRFYALADLEADFGVSTEEG